LICAERQEVVMFSGIGKVRAMRRVWVRHA
jgi:hypothetical protein